MEQNMYISFGIFKRMKINLTNIEKVIDDRNY